MHLRPCLKKEKLTIGDGFFLEIIRYEGWFLGKSQYLLDPYVLFWYYDILQHVIALQEHTGVEVHAANKIRSTNISVSKGVSRIKIYKSKLFSK